MPIMAASLVQSALFAFMHGLDSILTPATFVVALVLTALYEWRRTLIAPVTFHMGLNVACSILLLLVVQSSNNRPMLGISAYENAGPCRVRLVVHGSAAAQAGVEKDDVITAFDGEQVEDFPSLLRLVEQHTIGDVVGVSVLRGNTVIELQVKLQPSTNESQ